MASVSKRAWTHNGVKKEAWAVRYHDEKGVRRSKQFDQKKAADAFKRKVEREIEDGTHTPDGDSDTVDAVSREFVRHTEMRWRDGRIGRGRYEHLNRLVEANVVPILGRIRFRDLKASDVEGFYRDLVAKGLAPFTARSRVLDFAEVEKFARRRGHLKTQPVRDALAELRGIPRPRIRTFTSDEAARLLRVAGAHRPHAKVRFCAMMNLFVNLAAFCGMRQGEILGLTTASIDPERRIIRVRHNLTCYDELKGPKTASGVRDIPMPSHIIDLLDVWMRDHYVEDPRSLIFRTPKGTRIDAGNIHYSWRRLLEQAGLDHDDRPFHFHALRHFAASWMIANGLPVTDVAGLLGHCKFDTTLQVYAHSVLRPALRHETMERMVAALPSPALAA
ncbi:Site-specific recombinase XerD [Sphingomonas laterariae]|uniref:Site-specific recombinase XerD n=1 Tax=Edaphosphingomonas laterariae TaxID=861865 RepID=A0A239JK96_9SPHN|nr:site-specific integrase [Sphingomonas laterariae]SNT06255.1 Site-specific recombinase XerD [Sphingomonas laterariae]